ncbi:hypothetical protein T552_04175 [Pneumocystis carinii B80]|uniref:Uncharacterized protein n=1 Tax=Pneumocystis carinii (strain B80) TaxID=1408658 RepID=A0A0W4ZEB5_PNEC8|nr:hypothetical protein T552_04175 [Pneumocystis carinii B80]KTW26724.1 hypothetical protein T552_04175 [Pneumocystis carinii B80]
MNIYRRSEDFFYIFLINIYFYRLFLTSFHRIAIANSFDEYRFSVKSTMKDYNWRRWVKSRISFFSGEKRDLELDEMIVFSALKAGVKRINSYK